MKIVSLLPSATEIVCFLGLEDHLVGITHECDYPESIRDRPILTSSTIDHSRSTPFQIDKHIKESLHQGSSIYLLDRQLLDKLDPDLVITQELCDVCAVSYKEVQRAVKELYGERRVLSLDPGNIHDVLGTIMTVATTVGIEECARPLVSRLQDRIDRVVSLTKNISHRPRVYCMEWYDPPYSAGHWIPGMVEMAGGVEVLGNADLSSRSVTWEEVCSCSPEVIVLMPCGYDLAETIEHTKAVSFPAAWAELPAVKAGNLYAVNGSAYYNRPGPRLVDGLELLAQLLHPELNICEIKEDQAARVLI